MVTLQKTQRIAKIHPERNTCLQNFRHFTPKVGDHQSHLSLPSEQLCLQIMSVHAKLHLYQLAVHLASCSVTVNLKREGVCILLNNTCADGNNMPSFAGCKAVQDTVWMHQHRPFIQIQGFQDPQKTETSSETFRKETKMYPTWSWERGKNFFVSVYSQTWQLSALKARRQTGEQIITFPR